MKRISEHYPFHYLGKEVAIQNRQPESKTIKAWHRVLEEREQIFSSFYGLLDTKESVLRKERSQALAEQYLLLAYAAVRNDRSAAWFYLKEAFLQSPRVVLRPSSLGLVRGVFTKKEINHKGMKERRGQKREEINHKRTQKDTKEENL